MSVVRLALIALLVAPACSFNASGVGPGSGPDASHNAIDAPQAPIDAPMTMIDAPKPPIDAPVPPMIDAHLPPIDATMPPPIDATMPPPVDAAPPPPIDAATPPMIDATPPPPPVCGNGIVEGAEQCDDGNTISGDGCSATCLWEAGACGVGETLTALTPGVLTSGTNTGAVNDLTSATCGGAAAGEQVYTITVTSESDVTVDTNFAGTTFHTVEYLRSVCSSVASELGCSSGTITSTGSTLTADNVPPGTYFVVIDGYAGATGNFQVEVTISPNVAIGGMCDTTNHCDSSGVCVGGFCVSATSLCTMDATPITPDPTTPTSATTMGTSTYNPACAAGTSGPEDWYSVDVPPGPNQDLLVEVDSTGLLDGYDPIVEIDSTCSDASTSLSCSNVSTTTRRQEVALVPSAAPGTYYAVADGAGTTSGAYDLYAWLRTTVGLGAVCDRKVITSRCTTGYCVDQDGDGTATCTTLTPGIDMAGNADPCTTPDGPFTDDFAYEASISGTGDVDVVKLVPAVTSTIVATVYGPNGGCVVDTRMDLIGGNCAFPTTLATSDDEGIGPCPMIDTTGFGGATLTAGQTYWLRISRAAPSGTGLYTLVVDMVH
jgi:cysteine-rich repeat protein